MPESGLIKCPNCSFEFNGQEVLSHQAEEKIKKEYQQQLAQQNAILFKEREKIEQERAEFLLKKQNENQLFQEKVNKELEKEKQKLNAEAEAEKQKLKQELATENELKIQQLQKENEERKKENIALKQKEIALMQQEQKLKEEQENFQLNLQKQLLEQTETITQEARKKERELQELKFAEFEKKFADQKNLIEEMKRKAEQGSMQLQGEVLELALEELLKNEFPFDVIEGVAKGVKGADIIQTVMNNYHQPCGKIIMESKRTKAFSDGWIEKLKADQREQGATLAVIITETLPKDMPRFGRKDGIWICNFAEVKSLVFVLREMLLREFSIRTAEDNKGDKMQLLYNYLTSDDFRQRVEAIVEGFTTMKMDIEKEKRALQSIWKQREKQIEKVITNTVDMYASIKGIAGSAILPVKALELSMNEQNEALEE